METIEHLTIHKGGNANLIGFSSKSEFFNQRITYNVDEFSITFKIADIDDNKKVINPSQLPAGSYSFQIPVSMNLDIDKIEFKKYYFDEDSTEDEVIIDI